MSKAHSAAEHGKGIALAQIVEFLDDSGRKLLPRQRASFGMNRRGFSGEHFGQHSFSGLVCG